MRCCFRFCVRGAARLLIAFLLIAVTQLGRATAEERYVLVLPGPTCSVEVGNTGVKSFRLLIPAGRLKDVANDTGIVRVHVCECYLVAGDPQTCALAAVTKAARQLQLTPLDAAALADRIFMLVEDPVEFAKLYTVLSSEYPPPPNVPWHVLHGFNAPPGGGAGPPSQPPQPPSGAPMPPLAGGQKTDKRSCHVSPNVCVDPKTDETSAEFELHCEGLPTIVFSTDGKAGFKIGPLEVSLSVGGKDKR